MAAKHRNIPIIPVIFLLTRLSPLFTIVKIYVSIIPAGTNHAIQPKIPKQRPPKILPMIPPRPKKLIYKKTATIPITIRVIPVSNASLSLYSVTS